MSAEELSVEQKSPTPEDTLVAIEPATITEADTQSAAYQAALENAAWAALKRYSKTDITGAFNKNFSGERTLDGKLKRIDGTPSDDTAHSYISGLIAQGSLPEGVIAAITADANSQYREIQSSPDTIAAEPTSEKTKTAVTAPPEPLENPADAVTAEEAADPTLQRKLTENSWIAIQHYAEHPIHNDTSIKTLIEPFAKELSPDGYLIDKATGTVTQYTPHKLLESLALAGEIPDGQLERINHNALTEHRTEKNMTSLETTPQNPAEATPEAPHVEAPGAAATAEASAQLAKQWEVVARKATPTEEADPRYQADLHGISRKALEILAKDTPEMKAQIAQYGPELTPDGHFIDLATGIPTDITPLELVTKLENDGKIPTGARETIEHNVITYYRADRAAESADTATNEAVPPHDTLAVDYVESTANPADLAAIEADLATEKAPVGELPIEILPHTPADRTRLAAEQEAFAANPTGAPMAETDVHPSEESAADKLKDLGIDVVPQPPPPARKSVADQIAEARRRTDEAIAEHQASGDVDPKVLDSIKSVAGAEAAAAPVAAAPESKPETRRVAPPNPTVTAEQARAARINPKGAPTGFVPDIRIHPSVRVPGSQYDSDFIEDPIKTLGELNNPKAPETKPAVSPRLENKMGPETVNIPFDKRYATNPGAPVGAQPEAAKSAEAVKPFPQADKFLARQQSIFERKLQEAEAAGDAAKVTALKASAGEYKKATEELAKGNARPAHEIISKLIAGNAALFGQDSSKALEGAKLVKQHAELIEELNDEKNVAAAKEAAAKAAPAPKESTSGPQTGPDGERIKTPEEQAILDNLKKRDQELASKAEKAGLDEKSLNRIRKVGEWYKKQSKTKRVLIAAGLYAVASAGLLAGGSLGVGLASAAFAGKVGMRALGGTATFVTLEKVFQRKLEKKGDKAWVQNPTKIAFMSGLLVAIGIPGMAAAEVAHSEAGKLVGHKIGEFGSFAANTEAGKAAKNYALSAWEKYGGGTVSGVGHDTVPTPAATGSAFNGINAMPVEPNTPPGILEKDPHFIHKVAPNENIWRILGSYQAERVGSLSSEQRIYAIDAMKRVLQSKTPDELIKMGIASGKLDLITTNDTIDLNNLFKDPQVLEEIKKKALKLSPSQIQSIADHLKGTVRAAAPTVAAPYTGEAATARLNDLSYAQAHGQGVGAGTAPQSPTIPQPFQAPPIRPGLTGGGLLYPTNQGMPIPRPPIGGTLPSDLPPPPQPIDAPGVTGGPEALPAPSAPVAAEMNRFVNASLGADTTRTAQWQNISKEKVLDIDIKVTNDPNGEGAKFKSVNEMLKKLYSDTGVMPSRKDTVASYLQVATEIKMQGGIRK